MCVNVSNAARRSHDRTGGQVYFPASQDIAGHGSGGRSSRPANCEWAALLVATGPGPLLGKNGGGATATHGVLLPRVIPSAAPGFEEPAADRGRVCHRQRYCQPGVYRGNWRWPAVERGRPEHFHPHCCQVWVREAPLVPSRGRRFAPSVPTGNKRLTLFFPGEAAKNKPVPVDDVV